MEVGVETILKELLDALGISYNGVSQSALAGQTIFSVELADARHPLAAHPDMVHALDHLVKKIAEARLTPQKDSSERFMFLVDINNRRTRQIQDLQNKALMMAERARSFQYDVELNPMTGYERLIVHATLQDAPHVRTESQGEGRSRRVVIRYSA